ncbi:hypothetical protein [Melittangium boletus]|uniref:Uncharacterized protein n=1 Tax=Melittangium boletus DSM 14713 TaxID=1294270 RepID=A0A250IKS0_9BACT|nr:hypothetical protein [Melittangium boletus]ATB31771.1 hypothetical protein MEBOL_005240 [Melittangium boletus DSM 14713]
MAEVMSEDMGIRILRAVEALGTRMDRLEARMDRMEARMDQMEARMNRMEARMDQMEARMNRMEARMDKQEKWMERLGGEFIGFRDDVRGDLRQWRGEVRDELVRVNARINVTAETVVLMASVVRGPKAFSDDLENHLREISAQ